MAATRDNRDILPEQIGTLPHDGGTQSAVESLRCKEPRPKENEEMANRLSMKVRLVVAALALVAGGDVVNELVTADPAQAHARTHPTGGGD